MAGDEERYPYKVELEPVLRIDEFVAVAPELDRSKWMFYRVVYYEPIILALRTPTVPANNSIEWQPEELKLPRVMLGQVRIVSLPTGFRLRVYLPPSILRFQTSRAVGEIDRFIVRNYPHLTELWYWGDYAPKFIVFNDNTSDAAATVRFVGFRYTLEPVETRPQKYKVIYVTSQAPPPVD